MFISMIKWKLKSHTLTYINMFNLIRQDAALKFENI